MTKTESLRAAIKTMAIETCQEWLQCEMSEGVRAAIPNTKNLIMVGTQEWIAKNVPGVEAMVASALTDERIFEIGLALSIKAFTDKAFRDKNGSSGTASENEAFRKEIDFAGAIEREVITRLAATTQASTAQAERSDDSAEGLELLDSLIFNVDRSGNYSVEATLTFLGQIRQCFATSSTDAQAAAEVRDAALEEAARICEAEDGRDMYADAALANAAKAIRALRAGDTGEQADGGAHA